MQCFNVYMSAVYRVQCAVPRVQLEVCSVQCEVCNVTMCTCVCNMSSPFPLFVKSLQPLCSQTVLKSNVVFKRNFHLNGGPKINGFCFVVKILLLSIQPNKLD